MKTLRQGVVAASTCVAEQFEAKDLGAPFKVILHHAVTVKKDEKTGAVLSYKIPDLEGLIRVVVMSRVLHPRKLTGPDLKFVRKGIEMKQKDLASKIEISVEHLSRCETGALPMSPSSEKLFRIFALRTAAKLHKMKACEAKTKLEDALDELFDGFKPVSVFDVDDVLELHFSRGKAAEDAPSSPETETGAWERQCRAAA